MPASTTKARQNVALAKPPLHQRPTPVAGSGLALAWKIARTQGWRWLLFRLRYALRLRTGYFRRRLPAVPWEARPLAFWLKARVPTQAEEWLNWRDANGGRFFFATPPQEIAQYVTAGAIKEADAILGGRWPYFHDMWVETGFPPNWHMNPLTREHVDADRHWSNISDFGHGDIKLIWEPSRFAVAYRVARAWVATHDERFAEGFWTLLEDWAKKNPPQLGPNWKCGQEAAFRVMAWLFAWFAMVDAKASTAARQAKLAAMIAMHADRIEANIDYAISQRNNHGISEATALWSVGLLLPEFARAEHWCELGRCHLEKEAERQLGTDGSYVQHSFNYQRVMLHNYVWAMRLGEVNGQPLSRQLYDMVARSTEFLYRVTDTATGRTPNYGNNDGSLVLPLNGCAYDDFRPVVQAAHYLCHRRTAYAEGPWNEDLNWLFGETKETVAWIQDRAPSAPRALNAAIGGYYTMRGEESWAMVRCARYTSRPGQADQLHFDLWWRGLNLLGDPGTYLYNGAPEFNNAFNQTGVHNTVTVDARDQMTRVGPFLWVDVAQGTVRQSLRRGPMEYWEGEHDGYRGMGVRHRRAVLRLPDDRWVVIDDVIGTGEHCARLHWLLPDVPYQIGPDETSVMLKTAAGAVAIRLWCSADARVSLVRAGECVAGDGDDDPVLGWRSLNYAQKSAALSLCAEAQGMIPLRFVTVIMPGPKTSVRIDSSVVECRREFSVQRVELNATGESPVVASAECNGAVQAKLAVPERALHALLIHQAFAGTSEPGGTRHLELAQRAVEAGQRFTVIASDRSYVTGERIAPGNAWLTAESIEGVHVLRSYVYPSIHRSYIWRVVAFFSFMFSSAAAALAVRDVDVIVGTSPPIFQAVSAWLVAWLKRRPFLLEVRDLWPEFAIDIGVLRNPVLIRLSRQLERFLYRRATHVLVNSPAYVKYLISRGVERNKISLIPNGVDPEMFDPADRGLEVRRQFGLQDKFVVTYAGALGMANDIDTLIYAAEHLRGDDDVHLLLVGGGKEMTRLQQLARELGLRNVTFAGPQPKEKIASFLAASDVCVAILKDIPMFRTTYPNKVFDYMAAGRPTVLAIDGVIREVVEASGGGVFVHPGDAQGLVDAVRSLHADRARAAQMGAAAREYVVKHFARAAQADDFVRLLTQLAGETER